MAKEVRKIMTIHNSMSIPRDSLLVTVLATTSDNHQSVCLDMNRVVCCKCLFLFFSRNNTQLCSILRHRIHALNGLRDMEINTVTYTTKKGIKPLTLNHLVKGSNPLRPIDSTTIEDFTLDRSLDRQENHLEVSRSQIKDSQAEQEREGLYPELEQLTKNQLFQREKFYQRNRDSRDNLEGSSNGRIPDFDSGDEGSMPSPSKNMCGGSGVVNTLGRGPRDRRFDSDPSPQNKIKEAINLLKEIEGIVKEAS